MEDGVVEERTVRIEEESVDLEAKEPIEAVRERERQNKGMRERRRKGIKEGNFLRGMR